MKSLEKLNYDPTDEQPKNGVRLNKGAVQPATHKRRGSMFNKKLKERVSKLERKVFEEHSKEYNSKHHGLFFSLFKEESLEEEITDIRKRLNLLENYLDIVVKKETTNTQYVKKEKIKES